MKRKSLDRFRARHFRVAALRFVWVAALAVTCHVPCWSADYEAKPDDPYFAKFNPRKAPESGPMLLRKGDRLAIIGDSITEQRKYSRIIETYLTVCEPDLEINVRQYGWNGETAAGFLKRMDQDCLRFHPTVATLSYGMNDSRYRPYDEVNGEWYVSNYTAVALKLKAAGARVVLGSPGCAGKIAMWVKTRAGTLDEHNLNLCTLRDLDIGIAEKEHVRFADVFWPMYIAGFESRQRFGQDADHPYQLTGRDGIHPGWAGHLVMAYCYLRAMGLNGQIGAITVDYSSGQASASNGHTVDSFSDGDLTLTSRRYPFCADGPKDRDNSIRSGMTLVPFNQELNRFVLIVTNLPTSRCEIAWGEESHEYSAAALASGVNLTEDFRRTPFQPMFDKVDAAVEVKQAYETRQVKKIFHGEEGRRDIEAAVARTEEERAPLVSAVHDAFAPVTHHLWIRPLEAGDQ